VGRERGLVHELNHDEQADRGFQPWLRLLSEPEELGLETFNLTLNLLNFVYCAGLIYFFMFRGHNFVNLDFDI